MSRLKNISFIGAGNVAEHLARRLFESGCNLLQVYSPTRTKAPRIADQFEAQLVDDLSELSSDNDLVIVAIPDDAISKATTAIPHGIPVVHTSGSVNINVLSRSESYGVFYPLQSLKSGQTNNETIVPILIEASDPDFEKQLTELASLISNHISVCTSENRRKLHLAAVMVNNFTNHLYTVAENYCEQSKVDFGLLKPLIFETAKKVQENSPASLQTGPAMRNDNLIIAQHLAMLENDPTMNEIYRMMTQHIKNYPHQ